MKKYLTVVFAILLVFMVACGNETSENTSKSDDESDSLEKEGTESTVQEDDDYSFENEVGHFELLGAYGNDNMDDDGFYNIDFGGFLLELSAYLMDIELSEEAKFDEKYEEKDKVRAILLYTQAENTTDFDVSYNGDIVIVTSDGEQLYSDNGIMSENETVQTYYGKVKGEGYFIVPLEDDDSIPDSIELMMEPAYKVEDGAVDPVNGVLGEKQRFKFEYLSKD